MKLTETRLARIKVWHELSKQAVKYLPVASAAVMLSHVILLLLDIRIPIAEITFGTSLYGLLLMLFTSHGFGFCWLHRQFIFYTFAMTMCIHYQRSTGFDTYLSLAQWLMFLYGVSLFIILAYRRGICQK